MEVQEALLNTLGVFALRSGDPIGYTVQTRSVFAVSSVVLACRVIVGYPNMIYLNGQFTD